MSMAALNKNSQNTSYIEPWAAQNAKRLLKLAFPHGRGLLVCIWESKWCN